MYRAELRAMAQALAVCKVDACIFSDCKSVVNQIAKYRNDGIRNVEGPAPLIWEFLYDMLDLLPEDLVQVRCFEHLRNIIL